MFEGLQAHLWTKNSGRLLWMTHPAWPSNHWQIYTHDYDTHAAYYGVKKAVEPVHVQMNLPDYTVTVVNSTRDARTGLKLDDRACSTLDGAQSARSSMHAGRRQGQRHRRSSATSASRELRRAGTAWCIVALRLRDSRRHADFRQHLLAGQGRRQPPAAQRPAAAAI